LAALRLAEKFGTDFLDTKIVDYFEAGKEFEGNKKCASQATKLFTKQDLLAREDIC